MTFPDSLPDTSKWVLSFSLDAAWPLDILAVLVLFTPTF